MNAKIRRRDCEEYQEPPRKSRGQTLTPRRRDDLRKVNGYYGVCDAGAYESDQIFGTGLQ
jgi:hypothetical protein